MLAHFGALAGARAALAQQAEAGQEQLAQGWARLQRYREETGSKLLCTKDELTQLHARLEAIRYDVLQGVRGTDGRGGPPSGKGAAVWTPSVLQRGDAQNSGGGKLGWRSPCAWRKHHQELCMGGIHSQDS